MNPIELGKFIANLRNEKHLTQEELADKLYIDKRKISRWECGTSVPEFDMLIKLSDILDVSLYEFSICKRVENEKISKRLLNKFKSIKDIKKYNRKKKLIIIVLLLLFSFFILTTIFSIKYYDAVDLYELSSLDDSLIIDGDYIRINNKHILNIFKIDIKQEEKKMDISKCNYEIYDGKYRIFYININDYAHNNSLITGYHDEFEEKYKINNKLTLKVYCNNKEEIYTFGIKLIKKYDSKLF